MPDEIKQALDVLNKYIKETDPKSVPLEASAPMWDFYRAVEVWVYETD